MVISRKAAHAHSTFLHKTGSHTDQRRLATLSVSACTKPAFLTNSSEVTDTARRGVNCTPLAYGDCVVLIKTTRDFFPTAEQLQRFTELAELSNFLRI